MAIQAVASPRNRSFQQTVVRITPSKADNFQQCAQRFSWQERNNRSQRRQRGDHSPALAMGNAVHAMLKDVNQAILGGGTIPEISEALDKHWNGSHFQSREEAEDGKRNATIMLENYFTQLRNYHVSVSASERFETSPPMRINEHVSVILSGKLDVALESDDGTVFIEDYKTGHLLPTQGLLASLLSSTIYHLLGRQLYPSASRIVIGQIQPATGMHVTVTLTEEQIACSKEQIKAMAIAIATDPDMTGGEFTAIPGEYCSWCPVRDNGCPVYDLGAAREEVAF
jgi:PD-(D/E)XK nuclease superfamily